MRKSTVLAMFLLATTAMAVAGPVYAQDHAHGHDGAVEPVHDAGLIEQIMAEVAEGWENADGTPFERHFLDYEGARYVESGGQNEGLRDLIDHHVVPEGDSLSSLELNVTDIEVHFEGSFAWAIGNVALNATIAATGEALERSGYETFLFRWVDGAWKIVHTHSSTRAPRR